MAFCPECGREYSSQVVACRDCRILLSDEPPRPQGPVPVPWVRLCGISGLVEGSMLKGALESQGIHARVHSFDVPVYAGVRVDWSKKEWGELRVPADEEAEARLILEDFVHAVARLELDPLDSSEAETEGPDELADSS
ncbi:MAG TPA: hypothetical protein VKF80_05395 [Candidatus Eisenbacteria bacterium]|nr:hypothetical protein [Candidatus Eisenbacteria bacterium]